MAWTKLTMGGRWIWAQDNTQRDDKVVFRRTFFADGARLRASAPCHIAVDTKYQLYVNGACVVREGGLFRCSLPGSGYADCVDLSPHLVPGQNTLALLCWYFGAGGRNSEDSGGGLLRLSCPALSLFSDERFLCMRHPAYYDPGEPRPSMLFAGHNVGFDGGRDVGDFAAPDFTHPDLRPATAYDGEGFGDVYARPIPLHRFGPLVTHHVPDGVSAPVRIRLPHAMLFAPYVCAQGPGGAVVDVRTDRFSVPGGPGDQHHRYNSHRLEVRCGPGVTQVESMDCLYGEELAVTCSGPVTALQVGYRETGYDADIVGHFSCDDPAVGRLVDKACRTLYVCMRDAFMDCPDRERSQWIGDVSVQTPQAMLLLDGRARLLMKKAVHDFLFLRRGDVLVGNVPGTHAAELPAQSLNAIGTHGMIAQYVHYTGDEETLRDALDPSVAYLRLWDMDSDGLVLPRKGDWRWFDHLTGVDEAVLENAWYYMALQQALTACIRLGERSHVAFLADRRAALEQGFERAFWRGRFYASGDAPDDRANALAMLSGLCLPQRYPQVASVLTSVYNATPYMEHYVLSALCEMGHADLALRRMLARYGPQSGAGDSTLWEDFTVFGTRNHAWSGAPATIALLYLLGLHTQDAFATFTLRPRLDLAPNLRARFFAKDGPVEVTATPEGRLIVNNRSTSRHIEA